MLKRLGQLSFGRKLCLMLSVFLGVLSMILFARVAKLYWAKQRPPQLLSSVTIDGKYGFVDELGIMRIEPRWVNLGDNTFYSERLQREVIGKGFYIDSAGSSDEEIVLRSGEVVSSSSPRFEQLKDQFIKDRDGSWYLQSIRSSFKPPTTESAKAIMAAGNWDAVLDQPDKRGWRRVKRGKLIGWIDEHNREVIAPQWEETFEFDDADLAGVYNRSRWGYINRYGRLVLDYQWRSVQPFQANGLARVRIKDDEKAWGVINRDNKLVLIHNYHSISPFNEFGLAIAIDRECMWYTEAGKVLAPYPISTPNFSASGYTIVRDRKQVRIMDRFGKVDPRTWDSGELTAVGFSMRQNQHPFLEYPWLKPIVTATGIDQWEMFNGLSVVYDQNLREVFRSDTYYLRPLQFPFACGLFLCALLLGGAAFSPQPARVNSQPPGTR